MTALSLTLGIARDPTRAWLRLAGAGDQDLLRAWRNANAARFYRKVIVTAASQQAWFDAYCRRLDDYLFIVMSVDEPIGCLGIRFLDEAWDVYNVVRGISTARSRGFMSQAMGLMIAFASRTRDAPVRLEVLPDNPALAWYIRNGFVIVSDDSRRIRMVYRPRSDREQKEQS